MMRRKDMRPLWGVTRSFRRAAAPIIHEIGLIIASEMLERLERGFSRAVIIPAKCLQKSFAIVKSERSLA